MGVILSAASGWQLSNLLESATALLTWFLTSFGSLLNFFTSNTALLIWFFIALIGAVMVYLRKLL